MINKALIKNSICDDYVFSLKRHFQTWKCYLQAAGSTLTFEGEKYIHCVFKFFPIVISIIELL